MMEEQFITNVLNRCRPLFNSDFDDKIREIRSNIEGRDFVVIGGAGTIGSSVVKVLASLGAKKIQIVDLSENNLANLIRDLRNAQQNTCSQLETFAIDYTSEEFERFFVQQKQIDHVLNFAALKHVRSESNVFTLKRLIEVNVIHSIKAMKLAEQKGCKGYFCVSTDKAADPINIMGASKLLMEQFLFSEAKDIKVTSARFANVAFSDGSLLQSYEKRLKEKQPLVVPRNIKRYFVTPFEAAQICILACFSTQNKTILFPNPTDLFSPISIEEVAENFLKSCGFTPVLCKTESSAFDFIKRAPNKSSWPYFISSTDTTGEKECEEFYSMNERVSFSEFISFGTLTHNNSHHLDYSSFVKSWNGFEKLDHWTKSDITEIIQCSLPSFNHIEKHKYLDEKI